MLLSRTVSGPSSKYPRYFELVPVLAISVGISARLYHYLAQRSLFVDEIAISESIISKTYLELPAGFEYHQMAPIGWVYIQKAFGSFFSDPEVGLRFFPLILSLSSIFLFALLCSRLLPRIHMLVASSLYALNPVSIFQAANIKQYSADEFSAMVIALIFALALRHGKSTHLPTLISALCGGFFCLLISFTSSLVMAAVGGYALTIFLMRRNYRGLIVWLVICSLWLIAFILLYYFIYSKWSAIGHMKDDYWPNSFAPVPPLSIKDLFWYVRAIFRSFSYFFHEQSTIFFLFLYVWGTICAFFYRRFDIGVPAFLCLVVALAASGLRLYPFNGRLVQFLLPLLILVIAFGLLSMERLKVLGIQIVAIGYISALVGPMAVLGINVSKARAYEIEDTKSAFSLVARERQPNDIIYLHYGAIPAFWFYKSRFNLHSPTIIEGRSARAGWDFFLADIQGLRGRGRVWIIASHFSPAHNRMDEIEFIQFFARRYGDRLRSQAFEGSHVLLYNFYEGDDGLQPAIVSEPTRIYVPPHPVFRFRAGERK